MDAVLSRLPRKLTLTMWDFSWYTMTLPDEPYHDLAARCKEAADRGYNSIRICAMPFLLFTAEGKRPGPLHFGSLGEVGQRTRWYNCRGGAELDGHAHLLELFRQAKAHGLYIMLSSWEYQQSPSFLAYPALRDELAAIAPAERFMTLARSMDQLIRYIKGKASLIELFMPSCIMKWNSGSLPPWVPCRESAQRIRQGWWRPCSLISRKRWAISGGSIPMF